MWWLIAAAAVVKGISSLNQSNAEIDQWQGRERAQRFNAAVRRQQAGEVAEATSSREDQVRRQTRLALGANNTWLAQSGTGTGGSNADVAAQNEVFAELDALNVRYEGALQRQNLLMEAKGEDMGADVSHEQAHAASKNKIWGLLGSVMGPLSMGYGFGGGGGAGMSGGMTGGFGGGPTYA